MARPKEPKPDDLYTAQGMRAWYDYGNWPTITEVSKQLEIPRRTLHRWMAQGLSRDRNNLLAKGLIQAAKEHREESKK